MAVVIDGTGSIDIGDYPVGAGPAFMAIQTVDQNVTSSTWTKVTLGNELFDTDNCFTSSTFTPTVAGYYQLNGIVRGLSASNNVTSVSTGLYKNGTLYATSSTVSGGTSGFSNATSVVVYLNGTTDYVELYGFVTGTSPFLDYNSDGLCCSFSGCLVRAA